MSSSADPSILSVLISSWRASFAAPSRELRAACEVWARSPEDGPFEVRTFYNEQRVSTSAFLTLVDAESQSHDLLMFLRNRGWH